MRIYDNFNANYISLKGIKSFLQIIHFRVFNTIRFPQMSANFLCGVAAKNEFVKESTELLQMLIDSIASSIGLNGFLSRSDSSRANRMTDVYFFELEGHGEHIAKYHFYLTLNA